MKFCRCEYTGEILIGSESRGGLPLFGVFLPFIGFKWLPSDVDGAHDNTHWPPRYVSLKFGFMWLGHGSFWMPPWKPLTKFVGNIID